jgi:hypothetical protein
MSGAPCDKIRGDNLHVVRDNPSLKGAADVIRRWIDAVRAAMKSL